MTANGRIFADYLRNIHLHSFAATVAALRDNIRFIVNSINSMYPYIDLSLVDNEITSYCSIVPDIDENTGLARSGLLSTEQLDDYLTNNYTDIKNKIRIVDITRNQYESTPFNSIKSTYIDDANSRLSTSYSVYTNDCLGIVPLIVTATNALYF